MLAIIKDNNNNIKHIEDDYTNKQVFKNELRNNGIKVIEILNDKDLSIIKNIKTNGLLLNTNYKEDTIDYIKQVL